MTNTNVILTAHADLGMPVSGRAWVGSLRALPMTAVIAADIAVTTGAFPGTSAWSPPS